MALAELIVVMNRGRIEQQGSPQEIFSRPATEFVARFIGGHNIIRTAGGLLALRTDRVRIGRLNGQVAPSGSLLATVRNLEYQGAHVAIGLSSEIAPDLVASIPEHSYFADPIGPGDRVAVSWTDSDAHRLSHTT
jgi:putative spermidine/putrescine transport system ATP-binding protein